MVNFSSTEIQKRKDTKKMKKVLGSIAALSALGVTAAIDHAEAAPEQASSSGETSVALHTVEADTLRVRTGPGTSHGIIGLVKEGQSLQVTGEQQGWYEIDYNGQTAYVSKDYVSSTAYTVTVSSLRVRVGPSTSHPVIGYVQKGQEVTVTAELAQWYKIDFNGQSAYVSKDYISAAGENQAAQTSSPASVQHDGTYVVTATSLRVRVGAGVYHPIIGGVVEGQTLQVTGVENGWYRITYKGTTGYVSSEYVRFVKGGTTTATQDRYVNVSSLYVRSGAGTQYKALGSVKLGQKLQVSNEQNGFFQINYNGQTGYVAKAYLSETPVASTGSNQSPPASNNGSNTASLLAYAKSLVGTPYVWGGTTPAGFDCSGFVYHVYNKFDSSFGRTNTASYWRSLTKTTNPQPGDIIFFQNTYTAGPSHMGIYLGGGSFIQAGDSGVAISSLNNPYWKQHFLGYTKAN